MHRPDPEQWDIAREEAIPRLLENHGGQLYALSRRICGTPEEAEDLVQEIFVRAWRHWEQFDHRSSPMQWLFTIARHACQRMHRKRAGEPTRLESLDEMLPFGSPRVGIVPSDDSVLDEQFRREQRDAVGAAITLLPDDFRMPLVLKDIIGFSVREVGEILDLKEATVKTRVHRARLRLRQVLEHRLPQAELPAPAYSRQVCLDLLQAKQDCLDRGIAMPNAEQIVCERCAAVFASMDLARDVCRSMATGAMPQELRAQVLQRLREGGAAAKEPDPME